MKVKKHWIIICFSCKIYIKRFSWFCRRYLFRIYIQKNFFYEFWMILRNLSLAFQSSSVTSKKNAKQILFKCSGFSISNEACLLQISISEFTIILSFYYHWEKNSTLHFSDDYRMKIYIYKKTGNKNWWKKNWISKLF